MNKNKGYQIYHSFLGMILTFALIFWANEYFALKVHIAVSALYALIFATLIYFFDRSKNNLIRYIVLVSFIPFAGFIFLITRVNPYLWVKDIVDWCIRYDRTEKLYEIMPAYTVLAALALLVSVLMYLLVRRFLTRLLLAAGIFTVYIVFGILKINLGKIVVGIGIFYILSILIELSGTVYSRKTGVKDKKESILFLLPVCLILTVISTVLPSKPEPIQWEGVKSIYYSLKDRIDKLITEWEFFTVKGEGVFSISLSGYSEDGSLDNDDIKNSNKIALIVKGRKGLSPMYLTGSVSDIYTGYSWKKNKESLLAGEEEYRVDYAEFIYGLSRIDQEIMDEYKLFNNMSVEILYNNIKTRTFFYPLKSKWFDLSGKKYNLNTENAGITFSKAKGDNVSYELSYLELNFNEEKFQEILRASDSFSYKDGKDIDYERIETLEKKLGVKSLENFILNREDFYGLLKKRADEIRKRYTQLPESLPERVKELAKSITKDEDNNYDRLKAIEEYLLKLNYSYTPGEVPKSRDFVDYFIFENKKGYCTSFATSMAVLGRCIGIPTRYVEGFVVDYEDRTDGGFIVRNSNAHAWVEAYFEGIGWIPFEPTPNFNEIRYTAWPTPEIAQNVIPDYRYIPREAPHMEDAVKSDNNISTDRDKTGKILIWILVPLAVIIIILCAVISYYFILRYKYLKSFNKSDYSMKMYIIFVRILMLLKSEGYTIGKQETVLMLSDKVKNMYQYKNIKFKDVAEIFMAYRYGEIPVTKKDFGRVNTFYTGLRDQHNFGKKKISKLFEDFLFLIRINNLNIIN